MQQENMAKKMLIDATHAEPKQRQRPKSPNAPVAAVSPKRLRLRGRMLL